MAGDDHTDEIPKGPTNAEQVVALGTKYNEYKQSTGHHCGEQCTTCDYYYQYILNLRYDACGGNGGDGGNAGKGGSTTDIKIHLQSGVVETELIEHPGVNGAAGKPGNGANGLKADSDYYGDRKEHETAGCHGTFGWECNKHIDNTYYVNYRVENHDNECNGQDGIAGN